MTSNSQTLIELTTGIVSAYVSNNAVQRIELPRLIATVHEALGKRSSEAEPPRPAVSVKRSITPDYLVCLEDGKKLKMLKRYLQSRYNMTPADYCQKWGLPPDYPMVAPNYSRARAELAKQIGLGQSRPATVTRRARTGRAPATGGRSASLRVSG